ncbi:MotA/TolQ/ExbB proton channel family protein [Hanstruepera ponticola]|uniref:MotA/TolQ/ExbB proton channel family protein n=1 Tax=Hanstruepera ponticola TaxID=2042995 RepID=UPI00178236BF|nr:MotA/TolQ/ExbB proton channel family protein [Hanstruepera ponticola]
MRMPFTEFITSGDLKFIVVFVIFIGMALYHFTKKVQSKNKREATQLEYHNNRIDSAAFWIITSAVLSLLLGLMHSFYFIGKSGGGAPNLIFQGISFTLITPVLGVVLFMVCKMLKGIFNSINTPS